MNNEWGFNPTPEEKEVMLTWKAAAIADGWSDEPLYGSEGVERACKLRRDGFVAHVLTREPREAGKGHMAQRQAEYKVTVWGPDDLVVGIHHPYSMAALQRALRCCSACGAEGDTVRLAFADRVCPPCREKLKGEAERPGWCD